MKRRWIPWFLLSLVVVVVGTRCSRPPRVEPIPLPDWSSDLGHSVHSVEMVRLGPDSVAILWLSHSESFARPSAPTLKGRTRIVFGRPGQGTWSAPRAIDAVNSGSFMVHERDSLHVFLGPPPVYRHFLFTSPDSFVETPDPRFMDQAEWTGYNKPPRVVRLPARRLVVGLLVPEAFNLFKTWDNPRRARVFQVDESRSPVRRQEVDLSGLRTRDGRAGAIDLESVDGVAYVLVADNPPIVRLGAGITPRRMRAAQLFLAALR
jgi:hypothetical protein